MSYVNDYNTNLKDTNLFLDSNPYKIKLIAKMYCEKREKDHYEFAHLYFLECHNQKYILRSDCLIDDLWGTITRNIKLEEVEDYFTEINKLKSHFETTQYFTGADKYLEKKMVYPEMEIDFKEFFINADKNSTEFGIKEYEKFKEIDYIDFTILLNAQSIEYDEIKDYVNQFFKNTPIKGMMPRPRPAFILKDGTSISIQASSFTYCQPRIDNAEKYTSVEVGFPSKKFDELLEYAEDPEDPTNSVYGYVPVEILNNIIEREGIDPEFYKKYFNADYIIYK